jgi:hypothetical protein
LPAGGAVIVLGVFKQIDELFFAHSASFDLCARRCKDIVQRRAWP